MEGGGMLQALVELTFATKPLVSTGSALVKHLIIQEHIFATINVVQCTDYPNLIMKFSPA